MVPVAPSDTPGRPDQHDTPADAVTVAYVHSNDVAYSWHHSMVEMIGYDWANSGRIIRGGYIGMRCGATGLVEARNGTVKEFLESDKADWLLWIDTDMGFPKDLCERLLEAADPVERPIVGALCFAAGNRTGRPRRMALPRCSHHFRLGETAVRPGRVHDPLGLPAQHPRPVRGHRVGGDPDSQVRVREGRGEDAGPLV
jgi:hypothetical protein